MLGDDRPRVNGFAPIAPAGRIGDDGGGALRETAMRRTYLAAAAVMALTACGHVDDQDLAQLRPGRTTAAQAIDLLGSPDRDETLADGSRMLTYIGSRASTRIVNFIPAANLVWGGWDATTDEAGLMCAPDGTLRFHSWSSNQTRRNRVIGGATVKARPTPPAPEPPAATGTPPAQSHSAD